MITQMITAGAIMVGKASTHEIGIGTTGLNVVAGDSAAFGASLYELSCLFRSTIDMGNLPRQQL